MSEMVCDPDAGWGNKGTIWRHWSLEESELKCHLIEISDSLAHLIVFPSWEDHSQVLVARGEYASFYEGDKEWRINCDGIVTSMGQANIRICYEDVPGPSDGIQIGETVTVDGHTFQLLNLVCGTNARIVATVDGILHSSKAVAVAGASLASFPVAGIAVGGMYVAIKTVGGICTLALDRMAAGGLTPRDQEDNENRAADEHTNPDGTKPTPEDIKAADDEAEERTASWLNSDYVEKVRQLTAGEITQSTFSKWLKDTTYDLKLVILDEKFYTGSFALDIPCIVMAGDVYISGTAPQPNQAVKIMAVKKMFGFDWLAKDAELDSAISDGEYEYYTTVSLDEFGLIEVYGLIGKDWWHVLDKDITTEKHTVLVVTPMILLALLALLAMVLDKKYNFIGMFKKKRGKK